jgi:hypothetical protein
MGYVRDCLLGTTTAPPRAVWALDDAGGDFADFANGFTATTVGGPTYRVTGPVIRGEQTYGANFLRTVPEYATVSSTFDDGVTVFTLSFWFRSTDVNPSFLFGTSAGTLQSWSVYWPGDGQVHMYMMQTDGTSFYTSLFAGSGLHNGAWHHGVVWFDGTLCHSKFDGGSTTDSGATTGSWRGAHADPLVIAAQTSPGGNPWTGDLYGVGYWHAQLSAGEMSMLYSAFPKDKLVLA